MVEASDQLMTVMMLLSWRL